MFGSMSPSKMSFLEGHFERNNGLACKVQRSGRSVEAFESFSLHLAKEVFGTRGNVVDEMAGERFLLGEGLRLAHGALGTFDVASALGCEGAHEGGSVILDFAIHLIVGLDLHRTNERDRMRGAGCRSGSHGGDVGGFENKYSRGTCVPAGGRHVDDHRHGRTGNLLDDLAGRTDQAAGCIHLDQYSLRVAAVGFVDGAGDVLGADGLDGVVNRDFENLGGGG